VGWNPPFDPILPNLERVEWRKIQNLEFESITPADHAPEGQRQIWSSSSDETLCGDPLVLEVGVQAEPTLRPRRRAHCSATATSLARASLVSDRASGEGIVRHVTDARGT
jgi:hypothetical protein